MSVSLFPIVILETIADRRHHTSVGTPYDDRLHKQQHGPPAGSKFRSFKEVRYVVQPLKKNG